jgi:DNA polymerase III subunit gamma/tau
MAGQALYRKWRSQTFEEVIGQEHVALTLRNALREDRISHAYLFTGPRGTGKTSTARILAKAINCLAEDPAARPCNHCSICVAITEGRQLDLIEIDAASNRGIDEIRDLREKIGFRPNEARYKVYIIDEVHMLTKEAFNALLKTLEEPPPHAIFVLATTEPDRVPETVRSRCQRHDFRRVPIQKISAHLAEVLKAEGASATPEALLAIARRSTGSMRDAISLLDQLLSYGDDVVTLRRVEDVLGLVDASVISQLVDAMAAHDAAAGLTLINQLVSNGVELGELVDQVLAYLRTVLFVQMVRSAEALELPEETATSVMRQADALMPAAVLGALREFAEARSALRDQVPGVPQLPVEMAFVRTALPASAQAVAVVPTVNVERTLVEAPASFIRGPAQPERGAASAQAVRNERPAATPQVGTPRQETRPATGAHPAEPVADPDLLAAVQRNWERILERAKTTEGGSPMLQALFRASREMQTASGMLVLRFEHDSTRDALAKDKNRLTAEKVLEEILGRPVRLRCALVGESAGPSIQPAASSTTGKGESDDDVLLSDARKLGAKIKRLD